MANQIAVNVYAIDGIPQQQQGGIQVYLPTKEIFIQEYEAQNNPNVHSLVTNYPNPNSRSKTQEFQVWETVGDLETAANADGNSMFAADVYAINLSFLKNGGKPFLFPNDKPSIWPYSDGNINSLVTFKGNDYYTNETPSDLETAANAGGGGSPSYLVYTALLSQSGTDNPTATILENTLGGTPVWTRTNEGKYLCTLLNAFTENKTIFFVTPDVWNGNALYLFVGWKDASNIYLEASPGNPLWGQIDMGTPNYIEIRVYQ